MVLRKRNQVSTKIPKKNGLEDLKKARKNLDWLIEEVEKELNNDQ